jgi:hypothetical protein
MRRPVIVNEKRTKKFLKKFKVNVATGCWEWIGVIERGYGVFSTYDKTEKDNRNHVRAHAYSYVLHKGEIPPTLQIRHLCHNRKCVNPDHLDVGDAAENALDTVKAARQQHGVTHWNALLTENQVKDIAASELSTEELRRKYCISKSMVWLIKSGKAWKHLNIERKIKKRGVTLATIQDIKLAKGSLRSIAVKHKVSISTVWRIKQDMPVLVRSVE